MRRVAGIVCVLLLVFGLIGLWGWRQDRQASLNRRLIQAVRGDQPAEVERLLREGADPNVFPEGTNWSDLWTRLRSLWDSRFHPSHRIRPPILLDAIAHDRPEVARSLLAHGADPRGMTSDGKPCALFMAAMHGRDALLPLLTPAATPSAKANALSMAITWPRPATVRCLLGHGADPNARGRTGIPPLMIVLTNPPGPARMGLARMLLHAGADPRTTYTDYSGKIWTMLAIAAHPSRGYPHGDPAMVRLLNEAIKHHP